MGVAGGIAAQVLHAAAGIHSGCFGCACSARTSELDPGMNVDTIRTGPVDPEMPGASDIRQSNASAQICARVVALTRHGDAQAIPALPHGAACTT